MGQLMYTHEDTGRNALELTQILPGGGTSRITVVCEEIQFLTELPNGKAQIRLKDGMSILTAHSYDEVAKTWSYP
ncbi:hypothetical protein SEA_JONJAMES_173 [Gordonia Phage JonJames]|nr:hypothetical protein SEA_JONJAMES_173 [Gordonia Phage JonJames]